MTPGLHPIRLSFRQATGVYEFYASWTPPGEKDESALPTLQLFVHKPPAVIVFLTRRVSSLWVLCWFALALVIAAQIAKSARETANADSMSLFLFVPDYLRRLIEIGEADAEARIAEIARIAAPVSTTG